MLTISFKAPLQSTIMRDFVIGRLILLHYSGGSTEKKLIIRESEYLVGLTRNFTTMLFRAHR